MQYTIFGQNSRQGSYVLLIEVDRRVELAFGKFMKSAMFVLQPGYYLYVGSALGSAKGRFPLASRLLRHASRNEKKPAHTIRTALLDLFISWGYRSPAAHKGKKMYWHIDYLLNRPEAEIRHVYILLSPLRLEQELAALLASAPGALPVANRLGAQDANSGTHLFKIEAKDAFLTNLETRLKALV